MNPLNQHKTAFELLHFYQKECNDHGIRIYPVLYYHSYVLEIEFNKTKEFNPNNTLKLIRGETRYSINKKEWVNVLHQKYEEIYHTRILPRLNTGKAVGSGTVRAIYKNAG